MGWLGCCWSFSSSPAIVNSNKCQLVSRSSLFIGGAGLSHPIKSLMQWLDEAWAWRLVFGFGRSFSSISFVGSTGMFGMFDSISLLRGFDFGRLWFYQRFFSSVSFRSFQSCLFFCCLVKLWWLVLCSCPQSTVMLLSLGGQSDQSN